MGTNLKNGEPWWVAADVCRVLEIGNVTDVVGRLDHDERATLDIIEGGGRAHTPSIVCLQTIDGSPGCYHS